MAGTHDFTVPANTTFSRALRWKIDGKVQPVDGWAARLQARAGKGEPVAVIDVSTDAGSMVLAPDGWIYFVVNEEQTKDLPDGMVLAYDLRIWAPDASERLLEGRMFIDGGVTE